MSFLYFVEWLVKYELGRAPYILVFWVQDWEGWSIRFLDAAHPEPDFVHLKNC